MERERNLFYSIIVVCLNSGQRLHDTVESILEQKYSHYEIIVKDGGSTDGSVERLRQEYNDSRIHIESAEDRGIYDAMNQAVKLARGEYYLFLNTGDSFYDRDVLGKITLEIDKKRAKNKRPDIIYGNLYHKALDTVIYSVPEINDFACYRNVPCHQACFYHKSMFYGRGYKPEYDVRADYEHFLWCFYEKGAAIYNAPVVVAGYEGGGYSETKESRQRSAAQHRDIVLNYMGRKKADEYRLAMMLTLAPLRSAIAENKHLSSVYNGIKAAVYKMKG